MDCIIEIGTKVNYKMVFFIFYIKRICRNFRYHWEDFEAVLLRYGSWFSNPTNEPTLFDEFHTYLPLLNSSSLMAYHHSRIRANFPETYVDLDLLTCLLIKINACTTAGN